jgi:hypothetical protein
MQKVYLKRIRNLLAIFWFVDLMNSQMFEL